MIDVPVTQEQIENMNKPPLAVGEYLAVVTGVEEKYNEVKKSFGLNWSLLINSNPTSKSEGWDTEAKVVALDHYTFMGRKATADAKLVADPNPFSLVGIMSALGIVGKFDPADVRHRQVIVNIKHDPSMDDAEALKADPTHVVERYFPKVKFVKAYRVGNDLAPKLAHLADSAENTDPKPEVEEEY
jgi:hypothetical protein